MIAPDCSLEQYTSFCQTKDQFQLKIKFSSWTSTKSDRASMEEMGLLFYFFFIFLFF